MRVAIASVLLFACSRAGAPQPAVPQTSSSNPAPPDAGTGVAEPPDAGSSPDAGPLPDAGPSSDNGAPRMRGSLCDVSGWCWESPLPQGNWLNAVAAAGSSQVWFGGANGALFRWTEAGFEGTIGEITPDGIGGIYARADDDVWATTASTVLHFDGRVWSTVSDVTAAPNVAFSTLAGASDGTIFVAGSASGVGFVSLFDGNGWRDTYLPPGSHAYRMWAHDKSDAYATNWSAPGAVLHWNGEFWLSEAVGDAALIGIWGSDRDDIWAVGYGATIAHRDAAGWHIVQPATGISEYSSQAFTAVVGSSPADVWAIGSSTSSQRASGCMSEEGLLSHWDGVRWAPVPIEWNKGNCYLQSSVLRAAASDGAKIWFAGDQGVIAVGHGSGVTRISSLPNIGSMWGTAPDRIYATAGPDILRRDETGWVMHRTAGTKGSWLGALHGNGTGFVAAMDGYFAIHFAADGSSTASNEDVVWPSSYVGDTQAVWMTEDGQAFVAGRPDGNLPAHVLRWDGRRWSAGTLPGDASLAMFATSPIDVWAGGTNGNVFHFDGVQWHDVRNIDDGLILFAGFWNDTGGTIVSAGSNTLHAFSRWSGTAWQAIDAPVPVKYAQAIWTAGQDDVWVLGEALEPPQQSRLYHLRGGRIDSARVPWLFNYGRVFGIGFDGWVSGPAGEALHRRFNSR